MQNAYQNNLVVKHNLEKSKYMFVFFIGVYCGLPW